MGIMMMACGQHVMTLLVFFIANLAQGNCIKMHYNPQATVALVKNASLKNKSQWQLFLLKLTFLLWL